MYIQYIDGICEVCRKETDRVQLELWEQQHPLEAKGWLGSNPERAKARKDAGYYAWEYPVSPLIVIEAECHGDVMELCLEHFDDWVEETRAARLIVGQKK